MPGGDSAGEHSLQFSNSSSFSSATDSSDANASLVQHLQPLADTAGSAQLFSPRPLHAPECVRLPPRRVASSSVDAASTTLSDSGTRPPSPPPVVSVIVAAHSGSVSGDDTDFLHSTAPGDSPHCSFSAHRDSASPPRMSSYFCTEVAEEAAAADIPAEALMSEEESFEDIITPRSSTTAGASPCRPSPATAPAHTRAVERRGQSVVVEAAVVNASRARDAHERLCTFSAVTMQRYQLVKLKVVQRIYRIYYDKWRWRAAQSTPLATPMKISRDTQTPALPHRSMSMGTDFADVESFHASRSLSTASTPQRRLPSHSPPAASSPSPRHEEMNETHTSPLVRNAGAGKLRREVQLSTDTSPSPVRGQGGGVGGTLWSPASSLSRLQSSKARSDSAEVVTAHEWQPTIAPVMADGIGVRTKPAKLVDYGRHSDAPQRKSAHVANPVVKEPNVVPSPERIFRL